MARRVRGWQDVTSQTCDCYLKRHRSRSTGEGEAEEVHTAQGDGKRVWYRRDIREHRPAAGYSTGSPRTLGGGCPNSWHLHRERSGDPRTEEGDRAYGEVGAEVRQSGKHRATNRSARGQACKLLCPLALYGCWPKHLPETSQEVLSGDTRALAFPV